MSETKTNARSSRRKNSFWARLRRKNTKAVTKLKHIKEVRELEKRFESQVEPEASKST